MRDIVTAKWSLRPQRLVLGVVLIGMLLLTPQQCLGDDEPVAPTDPSQSQPAQKSPPDPAPAEPGSSFAASNIPAPSKHDEGRLEGVPNARQVSSMDKGSCFSCDDADSYSSCFDDKNPAAPTTCSSEFDKKNVTCYSYSLLYKPKKQDNKNKPKKQYKKDCWNTRAKECLVQILNIKNTDLYKKGKTGKCVKGLYTLRALACMEACMKSSGPIPDMKCYGKYYYDENKANLNDLKMEGYGVFGQDQYTELSLCICTGETCNDHSKGDIEKTVQASRAPILESSGLASMITFTLIVSTASFLRLA